MAEGPARRPRAHVVLIGPPGAGKTTVGELVAARLGVAFVDLDREIERRDGQTVAELFAERGEAHFRERERLVTGELRARPAMVIAAGGGWAADPANRALFRPGGHIVYLRVTPSTAVERMGEDVAQRPLLAGADPVGALAALIERRVSAYETADLQVDTERRTPSDVADEICARLGAADRRNTE